MNTDDGKWNEKRYWEITAMIKVPEWKREAEIIGNNCVDSMAFYDIWILIVWFYIISHFKENYHSH